MTVLVSKFRHRSQMCTDRLKLAASYPMDAVWFSICCSLQVYVQGRCLYLDTETFTHVNIIWMCHRYSFVIIQTILVKLVRYLKAISFKLSTEQLNRTIIFIISELRNKHALQKTYIILHLLQCLVRTSLQQT